MGAIPDYRLLVSLPISPPVAAGIYAGVEFGTLSRDGHCVNVGICRMTSEEFAALLPAREQRRCRRAVAEVLVDDTGVVSLFFARKAMLPCTERALFKAGYFPMPLGYELPAELLARLPENTRAHIPAGKYRVREERGGYRVRFG